jgi:hypothetical protein
MDETNYEDINDSSLTSDGEETLQTNDPIQEELSRVRPVRTEAEKATFTFKKQMEQLRKLGIDPSSLVETPKSPIYENDDDDNQPITRGEWKKLQQQTSQKTAIELAREIESESERELAIHYLESRIVPSGNPQEDLRLALAAVNSVKNSQIATMATNRGTPTRYASGSGMPAKPEKAPISDLTEIERTLKAQGLVTDDDIRSAREAAKLGMPKAI